MQEYSLQRITVSCVASKQAARRLKPCHLHNSTLQVFFSLALNKINVDIIGCISDYTYVMPAAAGCGHNAFVDRHFVKLSSSRWDAGVFAQHSSVLILQHAAIWHTATTPLNAFSQPFSHNNYQVTPCLVKQNFCKFKQHFFHKFEACSVDD